jgi:hypothetical protein
MTTDATKLRLPIISVAGLLAVLAPFAVKWTMTNARAEESQRRIEHLESRVDATDAESGKQGRRLERLEVLMEQTAKGVERIEARLDRR